MDERHARTQQRQGSSYLLLLMQHDVRFEAGHAGELLVAHRTGRVLPIVGAPVQRQVELHIERLGALVTAMWLFGEKSQEATEIQSSHSKCHLNTDEYHDLHSFQDTCDASAAVQSINPSPTHTAPQGRSQGLVRTPTSRQKVPGGMQRPVCCGGLSDSSREGLRTGPIFPPFPAQPHSYQQNQVDNKISKISNHKSITRFQQNCLSGPERLPRGRRSPLTGRESESSLAFVSLCDAEP